MLRLERLRSRIIRVHGLVGGRETLHISQEQVSPRYTDGYLPYWRLNTKYASRDLLSFRDWLSFKLVYPESKIIHKWDLNIREHPPYSPKELLTLNKQLDLLPSSSITYLNLEGLNLSPADLMQLAHVPNLAVLLLRQFIGTKEYHDHFMGNWKRMILEKQSFSKLTVLSWRQFSASFQASFSCFSAFPRLRFVQFEPIRSEQQATIIKIDGWEPLNNYPYVPANHIYCERACSLMCQRGCLLPLLTIL